MFLKMDLIFKHVINLNIEFETLLVLAREQSLSHVWASCHAISLLLRE